MTRRAGKPRQPKLTAPAQSTHGRHLGKDTATSQSGKTRVRRPIKLSLQLPAEIASFFQCVREGVLRAAAAFSNQVEVSFVSYPRLGEGDIPPFQHALEQGVRGIIIAPGHPLQIAPWIKRALRKRVAVVCVVTDAPGTARLTAVTPDHYASGSLVGELLHRILPQGGRLAVITGELATFDHAEKLRGLLAGLQMGGGRVVISSVFEAHDDLSLAYQQTRELLRHNHKIDAVYVSTANSMGVIEAAREVDPGGRVAIVTTDLFPDLVPFIRSGRVLATVHQRPVTQGRLAFEALYQYLAEDKQPPPVIKLAPNLVLRSNLDISMHSKPWEWE